MNLDLSFCEIDKAIRSKFNAFTVLSVKPVIFDNFLDFKKDSNTIYYGAFHLLEDSNATVKKNGLDYDIENNKLAIFSVSSSFDFHVFQGYEVKTSLSISVPFIGERTYLKLLDNGGVFPLGSGFKIYIGLNDDGGATALHVYDYVELHDLAPLFDNNTLSFNQNYYYHISDGVEIYNPLVGDAIINFSEYGDNKLLDLEIVENG